MKFDLKSISIALLCILSIYGLIVLIRKMISSEKNKKWFSENYRYTEEDGEDLEIYEEDDSSIPDYMKELSSLINDNKKVDNLMCNCPSNTIKYATFIKDKEGNKLCSNCKKIETKK